MQISLNELKKQKTSNRIYILGSGKSILDITEKEWKEGRYPGAIHIPLNKLYEGVKLYELNSRYLIYCETGRRASMGAELMKQMGFKNVHFLVGNYRLLS